MQPQQPLPEDATYEIIVKSLVESEAAITKACARHIKAGNAFTYADLYGIGIARRSLALSAGFRSMVEQRNSLTALPLVRMQLDTVLRLYAGFFTTDHQEFCKNVFSGKQVDRLKSDDGQQMKDHYLRDRVAERNPWIVEVYKMTSGYIHFSDRHIVGALRTKEDGSFEVIIGPKRARSRSQLLPRAYALYAPSQHHSRGCPRRLVRSYVQTRRNCHFGREVLGPRN